jgi:hypothetical protein
MRPDDQMEKALPASLREGLARQEYNIQKSRKGAYWEDRHQATALGRRAGYLNRCDFPKNIPAQPLHQPFGAIAVSLGFLRMSGAPLPAAAFILSAFIAPTGRSRWALLDAAAIDGTVGRYAFFHWFASHRLL